MIKPSEPCSLVGTILTVRTAFSLLFYSTSLASTTIGVGRACGNGSLVSSVSNTYIPDPLDFIYIYNFYLFIF